MRNEGSVFLRTAASASCPGACPNGRRRTVRSTGMRRQQMTNSGRPKPKPTIGTPRIDCNSTSLTRPSAEQFQAPCEAGPRRGESRWGLINVEMAKKTRKITQWGRRVSWEIFCLAKRPGSFVGVEPKTRLRGKPRTKRPGDCSRMARAGKSPPGIFAHWPKPGPAPSTAGPKDPCPQPFRDRVSCPRLTDFPTPSRKGPADDVGTIGRGAGEDAGVGAGERL